MRLPASVHFVQNDRRAHERTLLTRGSNENPIEHAKDGRGEQNDQRPDHFLQRVNSASERINFSVDFGEPRLHFSDLNIETGSLGVDLGSEDSNDALAGYLADFLFGGVG